MIVNLFNFGEIQALTLEPGKKDQLGMNNAEILRLGFCCPLKQTCVCAVDGW